MPQLSENVAAGQVVMYDGAEMVGKSVGIGASKLAAGDDPRLAYAGRVNLITFSASGVLDNTNFEQCLRDAVDAIYDIAANPRGNIILVPDGHHVLTGGTLAWGACRDNDMIVGMVGGGKILTRLSFTGIGAGVNALELNAGSAEGEYINGYFEGFTIDDNQTYSSQGRGVYMRQFKFTTMREIGIDGFAAGDEEADPLDGGCALYITDEDGAGNNQNNVFENISVSNTSVGVYARSLTISSFYNINFNNCLRNQLLLGGGYNQFDIYTPMWQGGGTFTPDPIAPQPPCIQTVFPNPGGNRISVFGQNYQEGYRTHFLKQTSPTITYDQFVFHGLNVNGITDAVFDVGECVLRIYDLRDQPEAGGIFIRAVSATEILWVGGKDPQNSNGTINTSILDLDESSLKVLTVLHPGGIFQGSRSAALSVVELLRPYCAEIWDFSAIATLELVDGADGVKRLNSIKGLVNGTVASAFGSGTRPIWHARDPNFGGRSSIQTTENGKEGLQFTLAAPIGIGESVGIGSCMRAPSTPTSGVIRGPVVWSGVDYGSRTQAWWVAANDFTTGGAHCAVGALVPGANNFVIDTNLCGEVAHLIVNQATLFTPTIEVGLTTLYVDSSAGSSYGSDTANPAQAVVTKGLIPACDATTSSNWSGSIVWIQNKRMPQGVLAQLYGLGNQLYGLSKVATPGNAVVMGNEAPVIFDTAGTFTYIVPQGYRVKGAWLASGAGGGGAGGGGGGGASGATTAGGGGGGGGSGGSCIINYVPLSVAAGTSLDVVVGAAGVGAVSAGAGGAATANGTTGTTGAAGGTSSISITAGALQVSAVGGAGGLLGGLGQGSGAGGSGGAQGQAGTRGANTYGNSTQTGGLGGAASQGGNFGVASTAPTLVPSAQFGLATAPYATAGSGAAAGTTDGTRTGGGGGGVGGISSPGWGFVIGSHAIPPLTGAGSGASRNGVAGGNGNNAGTGVAGAAALTNTGTGASGRGGAGGGGGSGGGAGSVTGGAGGAGAAGADGSPGIVVLEIIRI